MIRAPCSGDIPGYSAAWADPRTTRFIDGGPRPAAVSHAKFIQMTEMWGIYGFGYWVWESRATQDFVGCGGLADFNRGISELDGYPEAGWMVDPRHWGNSFATEAMQAILGWADTVAEMPETRCIIAPSNRASIAVAEAVGYRRHAAIDSILGPSMLMARDRRKAAAA